MNDDWVISIDKFWDLKNEINNYLALHDRIQQGNFLTQVELQCLILQLDDARDELREMAKSV